MSLYKKLFFAPLLLSSLFIMDNLAQAAVINVPKNYKSIQEALNEAKDGDKISVAAGTYQEQINFFGKKVTLESVSGASTTIIKGNKKEAVVTFSSGEVAATVLKGFTITNGAADTGGGIYCQEASPTIKDCTITGNSASWGGGIYCYKQTPNIINCTITNNTASKDGGGILCDESSPIITNCTINNNSAGEFFGGGIFCNNNSAPVISKCKISKNSAQFGAGIGSQGGTLRIINCVLVGNTARYGGGSIYCESSTLFVANSTFFSNAAKEDFGGAISSDKNATVTVVNSILWGDTARGSLNEINSNESKLEISYSDVQGNWKGKGNLDADPKFLDLSKGDYRLREGSPCIDKGTADAGKNIKIPSEDINGRKRPQGKGYDLGAFEF